MDNVLELVTKNPKKVLEMRDYDSNLISNYMANLVMDSKVDFDNEVCVGHDVTTFTLFGSRYVAVKNDEKIEVLIQYSIIDNKITNVIVDDTLIKSLIEDYQLDRFDVEC